MKPRLGQHFLIDQHILERIVRYADLNISDTVLEIGGGNGILTRKLAEVAGHVVTIELDRDLADRLTLMTRDTNVVVIQGDALKVELPYFNKIVANLPYQISSEITFKLLGAGFEYAVLMYQLEFAKRMLAAPGTADYSRLSVTAQYHANIEMLEIVPPSAFKPQPRVRSAILKLTPREAPYQVNDLDFFNGLLKAVFGQRRKMLKNSITAAAPMLGIPIGNISRLEENVLRRRPETLTPQELAGLSNIIMDGT
ncbi:MAG: 16S rRNA (adenine(1518)-N(6)/adenine(1519)-N(6))-dimethyltransferase RsmA [ANME-2 cluster archaeon]|nr:16S rRNA (adenine(1518)-N(6)/adenine(1519)-N(6))-dimethyltransferase RsmA [ANME-2 cluster archaeon]